MDFALHPQQEVFRREVQAFFASEPVQKELRNIQTAAPRAEAHPEAIYRWMGERGWLAADWPKQYGGLGLGVIEAAIVTEEMALHHVPDTHHVNTIDIVGKYLMLAGSDEQKKRFLPRMASGELQFAILYTEPDAGSDLASLRTRAEFDGGVYKLRGTKIYNVKTHQAQYALCAARTRNGKTKYDGITIFIVPLEGPGVEVRPLWSISNERFNEVVFDGLCVTPDNIVGTLHGGWPQLNQALSLERTGLDFNLKARAWLNALLPHTLATDRLDDDPIIAQEIIDLQTQVEAGRLMAWRCIDNLSRDQFDDVASAMSKWYNSELAKRVARLGLNLEGIAATLSRWDEQAPLDGLVDSICREAPGLTLAAGTSEIMLYLISAGLHLYE